MGKFKGDKTKISYGINISKLNNNPRKEVRPINALYNEQYLI